jgi:hypothetical protein
MSTSLAMRGKWLRTISSCLWKGAVGAGVALVVDHGKVGPRGPQGAKGMSGPPGIYADVGVLEARIASLDRRLSALSADCAISCAAPQKSEVWKQCGSIKRQQMAANPPPGMFRAGSEAIRR